MCNYFFLSLLEKNELNFFTFLTCLVTLNYFTEDYTTLITRLHG